MPAFRFQKVVSALPGSLDPDTAYFVRVGAGFDLYVTDSSGNAKALNSSGGAANSTVTIQRVVIGEETTAAGGETSIAFAHPPLSGVDLFIGAARLREGEDYTISGSTATLVGITLLAGQSVSRTYRWESVIDVGESSVIAGAQSRAKTSTLVYSGDTLMQVGYSSGGGYSVHSKTLSYTGGNLTQTVESFVYDGETWTLTTALAYSGGKLSTVATSLTRV